MNPLTNVRNIKQLNEREIRLGISEKSSWHQEYKDSAWIFVGGLPYTLTEGDVLCAFSQYGEIVNINLIRDKKTGKSKGYCFLCYDDQRSTILAVDNLNGIKLTGRTIRVDHVANYRIPKDHPDIDEITRSLRNEGCAPTISLNSNIDESDEIEEIKIVKSKTDKQKHKKKQKKVQHRKGVERKRKHESSSSSSSSDSSSENDKQSKRNDPHPVIKKEKSDDGFNKYENVHQRINESEIAGKDKSSSDVETKKKNSNVTNTVKLHSYVSYKSGTKLREGHDKKVTSLSSDTSSDSSDTEKEKLRSNRNHHYNSNYNSNDKFRDKRLKNARERSVESNDSSEHERDRREAYYRHKIDNSRSKNHPLHDHKRSDRDKYKHHADEKETYSEKHNYSRYSTSSRNKYSERRYHHSHSYKRY